MPSRIASPNASESEDEGDYEHILGYLDNADGTPSRLQSRSLRSSYADLQQLKITPITASGAKTRGRGKETSISPTDENGLHHRLGHRERRESLNDGVSVERIGAIDRDESFKEATEDINQENIHRKHED